MYLYRLHYLQCIPQSPVLPAVKCKQMCNMGSIKSIYLSTYEKQTAVSVGGGIEPRATVWVSTLHDVTAPWIRRRDIQYVRSCHTIKKSSVLNCVWLLKSSVDTVWFLNVTLTAILWLWLVSKLCRVSTAVSVGSSQAKSRGSRNKAV